MRQSKKELKVKLSKALKEEIAILPAGLQAILVDDLITAFESRLAVLSRAKSKSNADFAFEVALEVVQ